MYLSIEQLEVSIQALRTVNPFFGISFLAFKKLPLPIAQSARVNFTELVEEYLQRYYRPSELYQGYYHPFRTSDESKHWFAPRYGSTSLQRITKDTFGDALLHPSKSEWGWKPNYVATLRKHLGTAKLSAFDLAVWIFRAEDWPQTIQPDQIISRLFGEFNIDQDEINNLFNIQTPVLANPWLSKIPVTEDRLLSSIGYPPGILPEATSVLQLLELVGIGPAERFRYEPAERLNLIAGDNSLGKTFILECLWWCLTGNWLSYPVLPNRRVSAQRPAIYFETNVTSKRGSKFKANFDWEETDWKIAGKQSKQWMPGLVLYARHDGSFALWDPARVHNLQANPSKNKQEHIFFTRDQIWYGLPVGLDHKQWICSGLLRDWVSWQTGGDRYQSQYRALVASIKALSPANDEPLLPGEVRLMPPSAQEIPTLKMTYGEVPVIHASAAVQRVLALAYLLVWCWHAHVANSHMIRRKPQPRVVLIIDEVEAHLHPRWQRAIVPSLMQVMRELSPDVLPQVHIATHSPMVMASAEPIFQHQMDRLHHLRSENNQVLLEILPFVKRGTSDSWLLSNAFGLGQARSLPAEKAIEEAKALQLQPQPQKQEIQSVHDKLQQLLAPDDDFWPRWRYFATKHSVTK